MTAFLYRCPNTGFRVQGLTAEELAEDPSTFESVKCLVCRQIHLVNPTTGKVAGEDDE